MTPQVTDRDSIRSEKPERVGVLPYTLGAGFDALVESWSAAEEAGFDSVWAIDYAIATPELGPAWEASSLLVAMATRTHTIGIGVLVFDVLLRNPLLLAGSIAVAQSLSGGRVRVGLGVGDEFNRPEHLALGVPFPSFAERCRHLEACCRALPALWRGETVTDPVIGLSSAGFGPTSIDPPGLIVAGASTPVMLAAARYADGWNVDARDPAEFAARAAALGTIEASVGRSKPLTRSVYVRADGIGDGVRRSITEFAAAGADEVVLAIKSPHREAILRLGHDAL